MATHSDERLHHAALKNHADLLRRLQELQIGVDTVQYRQRVHEIARCWMELGREHLREAVSLRKARASRAVYSRAYYAAYSASKAVRYVTRGEVSLHGDDHKKIADLPDSFPDVAHWSAMLPRLYEHRLRADYDNWNDTRSENTISTDECVQHARRFIAVCLDFLRREYGFTL